MRLDARGLAALLCAVALLGGCKDKSEEPPAGDRALEQLRKEADRVNQGGASASPNEDPNARLADLAAGGGNEQAQALTLASKSAVKVETLSLQPIHLESLHSLRGTGVALTTPDLFVRVKLEARNEGKSVVHVPLSESTLVDAAGHEYPIARDAQNVGGTRKLDRTWEVEQQDALTLVFEVPPNAIAPGLALLLPTRGGDPIRIPLQ